MVEVYDLAFRLHMPVYRLLKEMPYEELLGWFEYFKQRPVGWQDDQRTYMLLQAQGVKEKPERLFNSLAALKRANNEDENRLANSIITSGLLNKLQNAAADNGIPWEITIDKN
jgi:hypothetical protein